MKLTNHWNRFIYPLWAPFYDSTLNCFVMPGHKRALQLLNLQPVERVLLIGVGTGADLSFLPEGVSATGIDICSHMLAKARLKLPLCPVAVELIQGDAQYLLVESG